MSMTHKVKLLYKSGLKNKSFLLAIKEANDDDPPGIFSSSIEDHIFASVYYGWLVGKYGNDWESHIKK